MRPRTPRLSQYCTAIFMRDLDRDRAGLGKEHAVEIARQQRRQPPRQRQRLLVRQPAEHHMRHGRELALDRRADMRMVVAVAGGPPARRCRRSARARRRARCGSPACAPPAAAASPSSSAHRAARRGRARPRTSRARCAVFAGIARHLALHCSLLSAHLRSPMQLARRLRASASSPIWSAATCAARWPRPCARTASGSSATAGGCCRSPATTIST